MQLWNILRNSINFDLASSRFAIVIEISYLGPYLYTLPSKLNATIKTLTTVSRIYLPSDTIDGNNEKKIQHDSA